MKQKKKKEAFVFPPEDDFACCSGTDCTGLIPAGLTSEEEAEAYQPRPWMGEDVTMSGKYHNSVMSKAKSQEGSGA